MALRGSSCFAVQPECLIIHVSICIVDYRSAEDVAKCCAALGQQTYNDFDVVICENGGIEGYDALRAALPQALPGGQAVECVLAPGNVGYAGGINICMAARPDADAWWVLNPDTRPDPQALRALVQRLEHGDCDAAGGTVHHDNGLVQCHVGRWRPWLARCESVGFGIPLTSPPDVTAMEQTMSYISGASMLISRRFLTMAGPMREDYFLYGEEVEWCLRARQRGMRLGFTPDARIEHAHGGTTGSGNAIRKRPKLPIYLDERNKLHIVRDTSAYRWPVSVVASLALLSLRYLPHKAFRQWAYALSGWWAGVRGLRGLPPWMSP
ncbi:MAG: glycosyltransferase family 2 protein [Sphingobium sp.]